MTQTPAETTVLLQKSLQEEFELLGKLAELRARINTSAESKYDRYNAGRLASQHQNIVKAIVKLSDNCFIGKFITETKFDVINLLYSISENMDTDCKMFQDCLKIRKSLEFLEWIQSIRMFSPD